MVTKVATVVTVALAWAASANARPHCCVKLAYCCKMKRACCPTDSMAAVAVLKASSAERQYAVAWASCTVKHDLPC